MICFPIQYIAVQCTVVRCSAWYILSLRQVENRGPSDIEEAEVYILWPSLRYCTLHTAHCTLQIKTLGHFRPIVTSNSIFAKLVCIPPNSRGSDSPLLYLTGQPSVEGPGRCRYVSEVNTHNIKVGQETLFVPDGR